LGGIIGLTEGYVIMLVDMFGEFCIRIDFIDGTFLIFHNIDMDDFQEKIFVDGFNGTWARHCGDGWMIVNWNNVKFVGARTLTSDCTSCNK
jgi:hypothetical protein